MKIKNIIVDIIMLIIVWTFLTCIAPKEIIKSPFDSPVIDYEEWIDTSKKVNDTINIEENFWMK